MMASNVYTKQTKRSYASGTRLVGMAILTVLWVVLSLFAFSFTGVEAAPSRETICGVYSITAKGEGLIGKGTLTIRLWGSNYTVSYGGEDLSKYRHKSFSFYPATGRALVEFYDDDGEARTAELYFNGDAGGITISGRSGKWKVTGRKIRSLAAEPSAPGGKPQPKKPAPQEKLNPAKSNEDQQKDPSIQSDTMQTKPGTGNPDALGNRGRGLWQNDDDYDRDNLPDSDAGKAAAAVGTGLGGAMLGGAAGAAAGGAAGGAAGAAGGAAGSGAAGGAGGCGYNYGDYDPNAEYYEDPSQTHRTKRHRHTSNKDDDSEGDGDDSGGGYDDSDSDYDDSDYDPEEGGYGPEEGGYGPEEGGYGPEEGGYGPEEGGYGPEEGGYGPEEGGFFTEEGGYADEPSEDYAGEPGEDYAGEPGEDYADEPGEDYADEPGEDYADEPGEDYADEPGEDCSDEPGEDYEDKPGEDNDEESGEDDDDNDDDDRDNYDDDDNDGDRDNYDDDDNDDDKRDTYEDNDDENNNQNHYGDDSEGDNDNRDGYGEDREDAGDYYEDAAADDSTSDELGDATEAENEAEPSGVTQGEPAADDMSMEMVPDNVSVGDDGSMHVITAEGKEIVYTRNEDGTYKNPTQTETGEDLVYQDEDGNWHKVEPGTVKQEEVIAAAQWQKDQAQRMLVEQAEEDAHRKALQDLEAEKDRAWQEKVDRDNRQLSQLTVELQNRSQEELRQMEAQDKKDDLIEEMRWQYARGDSSLSKEDIIDLMKREQLKNRIEGGYHEREGAEWDEHVVNAQEEKFFVDQSVNAYGMLSGNQAFSNAYSGASNYTEAVTDAVVNKKDLMKAVGKATDDTYVDILTNKAEDYGLHIMGNAIGSGAKQINENHYEGRDAMDGVDDAMLKGGAMGAAGKVMGKLVEKSRGTVLGTEIGGPKTDLGQHVHGYDADFDQNIRGAKPDVDSNGIRQTDIAQRRLGEGQFKTKTPLSDTDVKMGINEDVQANRSMNEVRKLNKISQQMDAMEKSNPKTYQNDPEYQKLSQQFEAQHKVIREDKVAIDRMNALQGDTGTNLRKHYNQTDMAYEKKVLQARNESIAEEYGLKSNEIGDFHATSHKIEQKLAGGAASHDLDTSPNQKVYSGTGKNQSVDFSQTDGDHHLIRGIYKAEYGRFPQTAAEYAEGQRLKEIRDFTNVSTRPSDSHELKHNPDAYVGSGKGEVNRVLEPEKYGTPEKGTGVFNEQTAAHKQGTPLERHHQQYAEAQELRNKLKTDSNLSAAEKTEMGKKIANLERQSASNHYESTRTTAKEAKIIKGINDANVKNGLEGGMSDDAKRIGDWANQVKEGKMSNAEYKQRVTEEYGSEEAAQRIVAKGFRDTNK